MNREERALLTLLGAHLRQDMPVLADRLDWDRLMELARIHNVLGILGCVAMSHPVCPDPDRQKLLRSVCMGTVAAYARRGIRTDALLASLAQAKIPHIAMKGAHLRQLYPVPELRTYNDVDLIIRPEDRKRCHEKMLELGFTCLTDHEPVYSYHREQELYEIHTAVTECRPESYFLELWDYARPAGEFSFRFDLSFHLAYLIVHIARHLNGAGAGVRMYLDVAAVIHSARDTLDWALVRDVLEREDMIPLADAVFAGVADWFGVDCPWQGAETDPELLEALGEFTLAGGVFGHHQRNDGMIAMTNSAGGTRLGTLVQRVFPPAASIQNRYPYLQGRSWLLPVAWVHRMAGIGGRWRKFTREAGEVLRADRDAVDAQRALKKRLGL